MTSEAELHATHRPNCTRRTRPRPSGTSATLLSWPGALPGVSPDLQADPWRLDSKTGSWSWSCKVSGVFADLEPVSGSNIGRLMEMRRIETGDPINAAVKGLFSKITESLSPDLRGVSTEAVEEVRTALTAAAVAAVLESYGLLPFCPTNHRPS